MVLDLPPNIDPHFGTAGNLLPKSKKMSHIFLGINPPCILRTLKFKVAGVKYASLGLNPKNGWPDLDDDTPQVNGGSMDPYQWWFQSGPHEDWVGTVETVTRASALVGGESQSKPGTNRIERPAMS